MRDAQTGRPRGFGFITINGAKATNAITDLDGKEFKGRNLRVNEALKKPERSPYEPRQGNSRQNRSEKQDDSDS
jgi:RNA recognition motif-containing protein